MATHEAMSAPRLRAAGPVRISLPAKVAYDPKALKDSIKNIVERLGCHALLRRLLVPDGEGFRHQPGREARSRFSTSAGTSLPADPVPWRATAALAPGRQIRPGRRRSLRLTA